MVKIPTNNNNKNKRFLYLNYQTSQQSEATIVIVVVIAVAAGAESLGCNCMTNSSCCRPPVDTSSMVEQLAGGVATSATSTTAGKT